MIDLRLNVFELRLAENQVHTIVDLVAKKTIDKFSYPLTGSQFKIYVLTDKENILYVGTTKTSIKIRLRYWLSVNGQNGYHGYKWKTMSTVRLFVWCFDEFDKVKIESVEAELVYLIRKKSGKWPISQNEIHFNNLFLPTGQLIAEKLYRQLTDKIKNHT